MVAKKYMLSADDDDQTLKTRAFDSLLFDLTDDDTDVIYIPNRRRPVYDIVIGAQFNTPVVFGLKLNAILMKNGKDKVRGANCVINIYNVSQVDFSETHLYTVPTIAQTNADGFFLADVSETLLGGLELNGEPVLSITVEIKRFAKSYYQKFYVNDIGIYDTVERIRRRVNMQESLIGDPESTIVRIS